MLYDWLHLVPSEMNAHILSMVVLNTAFLFGAIGVIAAHCHSRLFPPAALALSLLFIYVVNRTIPGSAIFSIWMPHVLLFCFLFFVTVCASVAVGRSSHIPWLVLSGLMLIHGHVAQPLFVGTLSVAALGTLLWSEGRSVGWREFLRRNRKPFVLSIVLVVLFAFPILLDVALHPDNNIRAILRHSAIHPGFQHSFMQSFKYEYSFLAFVPDTQVVLESPSAHIMLAGASKLYVVAYWCVGFLMMALVVGIYLTTGRRISRFVKYAAFEVVLISGLFYYWTLKMAGPLWNFNGYFFFCVQLLILLLLATLILDGLRLTVRPAIAVTLCVLLPLSMFGAKKSFANSVWGDAETNQLIAAMPPDDGHVIHFTFDPPYSGPIAGVASWLKHNHRQFCVDDLWGFYFGRDNVCRQFAGLTNIVFTSAPSPCERPCRVLTRDYRAELRLNPYPWFKLPFTIRPDDLSSLNKGFNESLGTEGPVWATGFARVYFYVAPDFSNTSRVRVTIVGKANPGRPVRILLNGHVLGLIVAGHDSTEFVAERSDFLSGENQLVIQVDDPLKVGGDPQNDPRVLGFSFLKAEFGPASP